MLIRFLFTLYLTNIALTRKLYSYREEDENTMAYVLAFGLFLMNIHSTLLCVEVFSNLDLGITHYWVPVPGKPKVIHGYLIGLIMMAILPWIGKKLNFIYKKYYNDFKPYRIAQSLVRYKAVSIIYLSLTLTFFVGMIILMVAYG